MNGSTMPSRSRRSNHCDECDLFRPFCICGEAAQLAERFQLKTRVVILMHVRELTLPTNTARLAAKALKYSEIRLRGAVQGPMSDEGLVTPDRQSVVLYPSEDAIELSPETLKRWDRPLRLIVPDGSWRQARKAVGREQALQDLPRVTLPPGPPSRYRLRKEPNEYSVSTFEAIARALGVIESAKLQTQLEDFFDMRVERTLWARGVIKTEECRFGIPQAAYDAFYADGCRGGEKAKRLLEEARQAAHAARAAAGL